MADTRIRSFNLSMIYKISNVRKTKIKIVNQSVSGYKVDIKTPVGRTYRDIEVFGDNLGDLRDGIKKIICNQSL